MRKQFCRVMAAASLLTWMTAGCAATVKTDVRGTSMTYEVHRLKGELAIDGNWNSPIWRDVKPLEVSHFMGDRPEHSPQTRAKLLYDDEAIHVIFQVKDQYVRAVASEHQASVCRDSCVEFFFTPSMAVETGYFNLEMNCGGTMLFHFQVVPRQGMPLDNEDLAKIKVAAALPRIVDPEITVPTIWTVQYRLPLDIIEKYDPKFRKPATGVMWRANFYKCADATSHPHWLTWAVVDRPRPDFHVPESFGVLEFR